MLTPGSWLYFVILFLLLLTGAFTSAAETALTSVGRLRVRHLVEQGVRAAETLETLLGHPARFLSTILFLNNAVNIGAASMATLIVARYLPGVPVAAVSTGIMTLVILTFGEITPKTFAAQNAERIALRVARLIDVLSKILSPLMRLFVLIANLFVRVLGGKTVTEVPFITEEEIKTIVSVGEESGAIEEEEKELIHSIFEFGDTVVREVMVPRMDMASVDAEAPIEEALSLIIKEGHSRIPVYQETVDNVVGIIYAKDLLIQMAKGKVDVPLSKLMRPAYYVPEAKKINELLRELQRKRQHMAVVVDEYGGTAGIVTIEDLLEEIVGEIFDEYDVAETMVERVDSSTVRVDARVNLDEVNELLGTRLSHDDIETIGGFVYSLVGKIPAPGEEVRFEDLTFKVEKIVGRRISKILITKEEAPVE